ncbi:MAG: hypothetical protein K9G48_12645 [Reyranella sp.]|nr:hypothetical protein [Reyranella sp.]
MSTDLTMEEAMRLQTFKPSAPGPVTDRETLTTLIDVAAVCLDSDNAGGTFTAEEIIAAVRSVLSEGQTVADADVLALLPGDTLDKVEGGYRWR